MANFLGQGIGLTSYINGESNFITDENSANFVKQFNDATLQNLTLTGDLIVQGASTSVSDLLVEDSLIELAINNKTSDNLNIGFFGTYNNGSGVKHSGLLRKKDTKDWHLFKDSNEAPQDFDNFTPTAYDKLTVGDLQTNGGIEVLGISQFEDNVIFNGSKIQTNSIETGDIIYTDNEVRLGVNAGSSNQGANAVAIGKQAGQTNQHNHSIVLNATGNTLNSTSENQFVVKPVRFLSSQPYSVYYNNTTGEISYGEIQQGGGGGLVVAGISQTSKITYDSPSTNLPRFITTTGFPVQVNAGQKVLVQFKAQFNMSAVQNVCFTIGRGGTSAVSTSYVNLANGVPFATTEIQLMSAAGLEDNFNTTLTSEYYPNANESENIDMMVLDTPSSAGTYYYSVRMRNFSNSITKLRNGYFIFTVIEEGGGGSFDPSAVLHITNTTESTSIDSGALVVDGGVGVEKNLYVGGDIDVSYTLRTQNDYLLFKTNNNATRMYLGNTFSKIYLTEDSTDIDTGALRLSGGMAVEKSITVGGNLNVIGDYYKNGVLVDIGGGSGSSVFTTKIEAPNYKWVDTSSAIGQVAKSLAISGSTNCWDLSVLTTYNNLTIGDDIFTSFNNGATNIVVGRGACQNANNATGNIVIGENSCAVMNGGINNLVIGHNSNKTYTNGSGNVILGNGVSDNPLLSQNLSNTIVLGHFIQPQNSNSFYVSNIRGSGSSIGPLHYDPASQEITYNTSSRRYKENIVDNTIDTSIIYKLRLVEFDRIDDKKHYIGLIAEEVNDVSPLFSFNNREGLIEGINWGNIQIFMLSEIQKLNSALGLLKKENDSLKNQLKVNQTNDMTTLYKVQTLESELQQIKAFLKL